LARAGKARRHALLLRGADPSRDRRGARGDRVARLPAPHKGDPASESEARRLTGARAARALEAEPREPSSVAALGQRGGHDVLPRRGKAVLLDDHPAVVVGARELGEEALEVGVAGAELAEDAVPPRLVPTGRTPQDVEANVLQVDVVDPVPPVAKPAQRVAPG